MALCVWGSKMPAVIRPELASLLWGGSWTAVSLLCLQISVPGKRVPISLGVWWHRYYSAGRAGTA